MQRVASPFAFFLLLPLFCCFISPKNNGWNRVKYALLWQLHVACCTCARNAASSCVAADAADLSAACCVPHVSSSLLINHSRAAETTRIRQARHSPRNSPETPFSDLRDNLGQIYVGCASERFGRNAFYAMRESWEGRRWREEGEKGVT